MSNAVKTERTVGQELTDDARISAAIDTIVDRVAEHSARITDIRGPREGLAESYQAFMERAAAVRGRGLLYPYIGSGVGNGALVELADGSVKWDMICGIGVNFFGHSDPDLIRASLEIAVDDVVKHGNLQSNWEAIAFAETLTAEAARASRLRYCYLSTSGAMANENALKICFQKRAPASRVIAFRDCFMGRSTTMAQIGDTPDYRVGIPLSTLVDYMPFWDEAEAARVGKTKFIDAAAAQLRRYLDRYPGQHACFIFELIQGEGGFNVGDRDFLKQLMEMCRADGVPVWDDEIQTFGRTTTMFAYERLGLGEYIDVLTVGKMTQACATLFTDAINPKAGLLSGTFTGEGQSFRVGRRIIERLRDGGYYGDTGKLARQHAAFAGQVRSLAQKHPDWFPPVAAAPDVVGGLGGMMRWTPFGGKKDAITKLCRVLFDEGVICFYCGHDPYHVRFLPPLGVFCDAHWPRVFEVVERAMSKVAPEVAGN